MKHRTEDEDIRDMILKFIMAYEFGFTPEQVEQMDAVQLEANLVLLEKLLKDTKGGDHKQVKKMMRKL